MEARWMRLVAVLSLGWASAAVWAGPEEAEDADIGLTDLQVSFAEVVAGARPAVSSPRAQPAGDDSRVDLADLGSEGLTVIVAPYLWLPAVDATTTTGPVSVDVDISFRDILDHFDVFGLSGRLEIWSGKWAFFTDGLYVALESDFSTPPASVANVDLTMATVDFGAIYRIAELPLGEEEEYPRLTFEATGGGRYGYLKTKVTVGPLPTLGGSEDWVSLVLGGRITLDISQKWALVVRGDVGGFGIGTAPDIEWNFWGGVRWQFVPNWTLVVTYRIYGIDYLRGSGLSTIGLDGEFSGPALGLAIKF